MKEYNILKWCEDNNYADIYYIDYGYRHIYYSGKIDLFQITMCCQLKVEIHNNEELYKRFECWEENQKLLMIKPQLIDFLFNAVENFRNSRYWMKRCNIKKEDLKGY